MTTKKKTQPTSKGKPKLSTPANVRRVFALLQDPRPSATAYNYLRQVYDELLNGAALLDFTEAQFFNFAFPRAARRAERKAQGQTVAHVETGAVRAYAELQSIIAQLDQGATLDQLAEAREAKRAELRAATARAELDAPEPKNKLSKEWRYWKLRHLEADFASGDPARFQAAFDYFSKLIRGLLADENFYHVSHARALLPQLIIARQEIDEITQRERRAQAGQKAATTRKRK